MIEKNHPDLQAGILKFTGVTEQERKRGEKETLMTQHAAALITQQLLN